MRAHDCDLAFELSRVAHCLISSFALALVVVVFEPVHSFVVVVLVFVLVLVFAAVAESLNELLLSTDCARFLLDSLGFRRVGDRHLSVVQDPPAAVSLADLYCCYLMISFAPPLSFDLLPEYRWHFRLFRTSIPQQDTPSLSSILVASILSSQ